MGEEGERASGASGGGMKSQCHQCQQSTRGVFDLTNRDSKTLQLALLLAIRCHCTVPCKRLRDSPAAMLHLVNAARG